MARSSVKTTAKPPEDEPHAVTVSVDDAAELAKAPSAELPASVSDADTPQKQYQADTLAYQSRIKIVEAWRYPGSLKNAPSFIDPNWAAWGERDDAHIPPLEPGPALRIPARTPTGDKLARAGDYVVRQEVALTSELAGEVEVDVWPADQFERLFMPKTEKPFRPFNPPNQSENQTENGSAPRISPEIQDAAVHAAEVPESTHSDLTGENGDPRLP
jgi:hypothetical protein